MGYEVCNLLNRKSYCFSNVPIFQTLTLDEMEKIAQIITSRCYLKQEFILFVGDYEKKLFILREGKAKVTYVSKCGREQIVRFINPGDFFGDETLFKNEPLPYNIEAVETTRICVLDGNELKNILKKSPSTLIKIIEQLIDRADDMRERLCQITYMGVEQRLAGFIFKNTCVNGCLSVQRRDLAPLLGTTRETISRKLSLFQKKGYIFVEGKNIKIINQSALQILANEDE